MRDASMRHRSFGREGIPDTDVFGQSDAFNPGKYAPAGETIRPPSRMPIAPQRRDPKPSR
jgi:hypothetical protein